jgi:TPR repeat protein
MEETLREELLAKTKLALDADDWDAVARLWQPWIDQGDAEAEYQLAYHYLWCTPCEDDATRERMEALIRDAAAKDHPDAIWFQATHQTRSRETNSELDRLLLRAGQLGSVNAQRELGAMYATGDWSGPKDLVEAARWYRLAAEKGDARSQYDLGFMLLLGEGEENRPPTDSSGAPRQSQGRQAHFGRYSIPYAVGRTVGTWAGATHRTMSSAFKSSQKEEQEV